MKLNSKVKEIIEKLEDNNYESYIVGGAPRDFILERPINDYDIVTTASLKEIKELFPNEHFINYKKDITLGLIYNKKIIDISTTNDKTIEEDLKRRDFTINSILYHPKRGWIDKYNGRSDIENKVIKSIANPKDMIEADPIRIMRAIRFEATLGFKIEDRLENALFEFKHLLLNVSVERIKDELNKILMIDVPSAIIKKYLDIFDFIIPGLKKCEGFNQHSKYHIYPLLDHILKVLDSTRNILPLRIAALLHDIKKPEYFTIDDLGNGHFFGHDLASASYAEKLLSNLKYGNKDIDLVVKLIEFHDYRPSMNEKSLLKFLKKYGTEDIDLLFGLKRADVLGQHPNYFYQVNELDEMYAEIVKLIETKKFITKELLNIKASDLIEIGYPKDKTISLALNKMLELVRSGSLENEKEILISYARKLINYE